MRKNGARILYRRRKNQARKKGILTLDLLEQVGDVFVVEGQGATQQRIKDHPTGPHVHLRTLLMNE